MIQTEREFTLPVGLADEDGTLHRDGVMRMARAADEILPLAEASVQKNPSYLTVILLARVVTRLGQLEPITPMTIERLFAVDLAYLQDLYNEMNMLDGDGSTVSCPSCNHEFGVDRAASGRS
jgi:hypothetical protein